MPDETHDEMRFGFDFKNNTVITDAQFVQAFEVALKRFWRDIVCDKPLQFLKNSAL